MNLVNELAENFSGLCISEDKCRLYSKDTKKGYYYYNSINNKEKKKATVIMINPSEKQECEDGTPDDTVHNLRKILLESKSPEFSSFEVINLYSQISPNPKKVIKYQTELLNEKIVKYVIKKADIVIPAWGVESKFSEQAISLIEEIKEECKHKDIRIVVNKFPCHFSKQCTSKNRNPEFIEYSF